MGSQSLAVAWLLGAVSAEGSPALGQQTQPGGQGAFGAARENRVDPLVTWAAGEVLFAKLRWTTVSSSSYLYGTGPPTEAWRHMTWSSGEHGGWRVGFAVCFLEMFREAGSASVVPSGAVGLCGPSSQLTEAGLDSAPRSRRPGQLPFAQRGPE